MDLRRAKERAPGSQAGPPAAHLSSLLSVFGYILAVSYPLLALSTGARALYQLLLKEGVTNYLAPSMSGVAALCYLAATIGFAYRHRWAWRLSVSFVVPDVIGRTVWRHFGADYGYFPLFQPLIGLAWLFWPETRRAYGLWTADQQGKTREQN